ASAIGEAFRYTGRRFDTETGLYYYRARYYSPLLGRFLHSDPIGYKPDLNLYTYVGNYLLDKTDPSGLCSTVNGQITDCDVKVEGLSKNKFVAFFQKQ